MSEIYFAIKGRSVSGCDVAGIIYSCLLL